MMQHTVEKMFVVAGLMPTWRDTALFLGSGASGKAAVI